MATVVWETAFEISLSHVWILRSAAETAAAAALAAHIHTGICSTLGYVHQPCLWPLWDAASAFLWFVPTAANLWQRLTHIA